MFNEVNHAQSLPQSRISRMLKVQRMLQWLAPLTVIALAASGMVRGGVPATSVVARSQGQRDVDVVIANGIVVTMDAERRVFTPGSIAISGNSIVDVGAADRIGREYKGRDTIDALGRVVIPGLINTH